MAQERVSSTSNEVAIHVNQLTLKGFLSAVGVANFLGISYASIPARFRQAIPKNLSDQTGLVNATRYGPLCPQPIDDLRAVRDHLYVGIRPMGETPVDEFECLRINVYAPPNVLGKGEKLPVLVFIHGGGWTFGDGGSEYEGNFLVEQSIKIGKPFIFVTFNYRVGYYGWICSKELKAEAISQGEEGWANQGLYDQRLALEWIQKNIHFFGGDPSRVTISGESAGGWSVLAHVHSNAPLFERAIIMSCPNWPLSTFEDTQKNFDNVIAAIGVPATASAEEKLSALRQLTPDQLAGTLQQAYAAVTWDEKWFVGHTPYLELDQITGLPSWLKSVMIGNTKEEASLWAINWRSFDAADMKEAVESCTADPHLTQEIVDAYGISNHDNQVALNGLINYATEATFGNIATRIGENPNVYVYSFDQRDEFEDSEIKGYAYHAIDCVYYCRLPAVAGPKATSSSILTANAVTRTFAEFIYGMAPWPEYKNNGFIFSFDGPRTGVSTTSAITERLKKFVGQGDKREKVFREGGRGVMMKYLAISKRNS